MTSGYVSFYIDSILVGAFDARRTADRGASRDVADTRGDGWLVDQLFRLPTTLAMAVMVFQLRVVTGTPKSRSNVPR
jgi:hypothetical protein